MVAFAQRMIQIPSPSGDEKKCAETVKAEMEGLGYDAVQIDGAGNVIGLMRGTQNDVAPVLLNSHLDHVDPGDLSQWARPPYAGILEGDVLYGRGASDTKGALAAQVYAPALLRLVGFRPRQDVFVTGVVLEETGGLGTRQLIQKGGLPEPGLALLGEATSNELCIGHRGRAEFRLRVQGKAAHASAPERGKNPNYGMARVLLELEQLSSNLEGHPTLGRSTLAPTIVRSGPSSRNVIPDWSEALIDWRYTVETPDGMLEALRDALDSAGEDGIAEFTMQDSITYTGVEGHDRQLVHSYIMNASHPAVLKVAQVLERLKGRPPEIGTWRFCTDGGYLNAVEGIPTIGFSPCEERYAHTVEDQVRVSMMVEALECYAALLIEGLTTF
jgi:putative selenium metabolism hydrolase